MAAVYSAQRSVRALTRLFRFRSARVAAARKADRERCDERSRGALATLRAGLDQHWSDEGAYLLRKAARGRRAADEPR